MQINKYNFELSIIEERHFYIFARLLQINLFALTFLLRSSRGLLNTEQAMPASHVPCLTKVLLTEPSSQDTK